jgi:hypothetical protein
MAAMTYPGFGFPPLGDDGQIDKQAIVVCGDAYYIHQLGPVVQQAMSALCEDFIVGKFVPPDALRPTLDTLVALSPGPNDARLAEGLEETFQDGVIEATVERLAAQVDEFDRDGRATVRRMVLRLIAESQRELTARGGSGPRAAAEVLGVPFAVGLGLAQDPDVQQHAGIEAPGDTIATLAALAGMPDEDVRRRALRASTVNRLCQPKMLAEDATFAWSDGNIQALGDVLAGWPADGAVSRRVDGVIGDRRANAQVALLRTRYATLSHFG